MASATPAGSDAGGASSKPAGAASSKPAGAPKSKPISQSDLQWNPPRTTYKRSSDDMELGVYRSHVAIMPEKEDDPITYEYRFEKGAVQSGNFIVPVYIDCSLIKDESTGNFVCRQCKRPQIAPENRIEHTDMCACRPVRGGSRKRRKSRKARKSRTTSINH
jgi:hypothetical protein